jgi:signal transduction histidine kinase
MIGTLLDITERKRAESEREATLQWLRAVLEQVPVGMLLFHGAAGERVEVNRRLQLMLGGPVGRREKDPGLLLSVDGRPIPPEQFPSARALRGETLEGAEYLVRTAADTFLPVLGSAVPLLDASGNVQGAVVAVLDISAAKELERLRAEWSSVVAHDLRQPINTIALSVQALLRAGADAKVRDRHVRSVDAAARRLNRMVGDLMDLSRLEARRLELQRQPTDVPATVRASVERVAQSAPDRRFDVVVHGEIPPVPADADRVAQIVENLLSNAVKYGAAGTPIRIDEERGQGELSVAVTNIGEGIPPEQVPQLFQRFRRTEGAKAAKIKGTGLGLYITRELVEAHGGQITVESTPGSTTTFRFTLPFG